MKNKNKYFTTRLNGLFSDIDKIAEYPNITPNGKPNFWKNDEIKILKQTFSKFIADYNLLNTELYHRFKYLIEQL